MTDKFKQECKNMAYKNRLGKIELDNETISNSDYLSSFEITDSCISNGTILGNTNSKSIKINTLNNYSLADKQITPFIGVKYDDSSEEYIKLGKYTITNEINDKTSKNGEYTGIDSFNKLEQVYNCSIEDLENATILDFYIDVCKQIDLTPKKLEFINQDIVIGGNPFTNNETCRIVLQNIAQVFCSFANIDWETEEIDLIWFDEDYSETLTKEDYSTLEKNQIYGPINSLVIKESAIEGENIVREDTESIEINGETQISIEDNYFLYTEELRTQAIDNIWEKLKGFTYVDCKITSYTGKPYLKKGNKIKVQDDDETYFDTYVLSHNFMFDGTFKSIIESPALTKTQTALKNTKSVTSYFRKVERSVNKIEGKILDVIEQVSENSEKIVQLDMDIDGINTKVSDVKTTVEDITTTTQTSKGGNHLYLEDAMESNALEYIVEGKSEQETSIQSKNLLDLEDDFSSTVDGITVTTNNGTIHVVGTSTATVTMLIPIKLINLNGDYYFSTKITGTVAKNNCSITFYDENKQAINQWYTFETNTQIGNTFNSTANGKYVRLYINSGVTLDYYIYPQLEIGTIMSTYTPFIPDSPSPDYPSKIETIKGIRNFFEIKNIERTINGITFTPNKDGSITATGTATANTVYPLLTNSETITDVLTLEKGTYIISDGVSDYTNYFIQTRIQYEDGTKFFNTGQKEFGKTAAIVLDSSLKMSSWIYIRNGVTVENLIFKPMLEEGKIIHDYVPYGSWSKVKITGKNIFDKTNYQQAYITNTGNITILNTVALFDYINIESSTEYTISLNKNVTGYRYALYDKNKTFISRSDEFKTNTTISIPSNAMYIRFFFNIDNSTITQEKIDNLDIQFEKGTTTEYEPYKEQSILIDMNKPNLFDKDNANILENMGIYYSGLFGANTTGNKIIYIDCESNTTYTIRKNISQRFRVGTAPSLDTEVQLTNYQANDNATNLIVTSGENEKYLIVQYCGTDDTDEKEILNSIKIYEGIGSDDYYELSSRNDIKDILSIKNGIANINQKIGKYVFDGSETIYKRGNDGDGSTTLSFNILIPNLDNTKATMICSHFILDQNSTNGIEGIWADAGTPYLIYLEIKRDRLETNDVEGLKTWLSNNPVTVYYELVEPQTIELGNCDIPLYEGVNNVTLINDLQTTTSVSYLRKTPISQDYATNQQLNITNSNLNNTSTQLNQTQQDLNDTNTNLNNNYYNKEQIDSITTTTQEEITTLKNAVETTTSSTNLQISVLEEQIKNGVTSVKTETGYVFDKDGLTIAKTGSEMSSILDNDGLAVKRNDTEVLTVRSAGVETENLMVRTYFTVGSYTRVEDYGDGTGFFHIGGV